MYSQTVGRRRIRGDDLLQATRTMSMMRRLRAYENTMAFGGVATGNMNALDALSVTGIITYSGLIFMSFACKIKSNVSVQR